MKVETFVASDQRLKVRFLSGTPSPQTVIWTAGHVCVSERTLSEEFEPTGDFNLVDSIHETKHWSDSRFGEASIRHCLSQHHYSVAEHVHLAVSVEGFPHSVLAQLTRHRLSGFSVQSGRFSGQRVIDAAEGKVDIEDVFFFRPTGTYKRKYPEPGTYTYTAEDRLQDIEAAQIAAGVYRHKVVKQGYDFEHARAMLPYEGRQNFVMSFNLRHALHILAMRGKPDAQLEAQAFAYKLHELLSEWCPEIMEWFSPQIQKIRHAP